MAGLGIVFLLLQVLIVAFFLYWVIRLGVKHGVRSYYEEAARAAKSADKTGPS